MSNHQLVDAIRIAVDAHGYQLDKAGLPYILHPLHVMNSVDSIDAKIVAVLHDTIEDTTQTLAGLCSAGFSPEIVNAVDAISKRKGESYDDYLARVKANPLALRVKLADMAHNSSSQRLEALEPGERKYLEGKYFSARTFLAGGYGLLPLVDGMGFGAAVKYLESVGYENPYAYLIKSEREGRIDLDFKNTITLVG